MAPSGIARMAEFLHPKGVGGSKPLWQPNDSRLAEVAEALIGLEAGIRNVSLTPWRSAPADTAASGSRRAEPPPCRSLPWSCRPPCIRFRIPPSNRLHSVELTALTVGSFFRLSHHVAG